MKDKVCGNLFIGDGEITLTISTFSMEGGKYSMCIQNFKNLNFFTANKKNNRSFEL